MDDVADVLARDATIHVTGLWSFNWGFCRGICIDIGILIWEHGPTTAYVGYICRDHQTPPKQSLTKSTSRMRVKRFGVPVSGIGFTVSS